MAELFAAFGINWKLLLAQGFNFGLLLLALWWFLYRPVLGMLDERRGVIEKGVKDAAAAGEMLARADGEGKEIVTKASQAAEALAATARATSLGQRVWLSARAAIMARIRSRGSPSPRSLVSVPSSAALDIIRPHPRAWLQGR